MSEKLYENVPSTSNIISRGKESHIPVCGANVYPSMTPEPEPGSHESIQQPTTPFNLHPENSAQNPKKIILSIPIQSMSAPSLSLPNLPSHLKFLTIFSISATILPPLIIHLLHKSARPKKKDSAKDPPDSSHEDWAWDAHGFRADDELAWPLIPLDREISRSVAGAPPTEDLGHGGDVAVATPTAGEDKGQSS